MRGLFVSGVPDRPTPLRLTLLAEAQVFLPSRLREGLGVGFNP